MENVSELLLRNAARFRQAELLLVNPPRDSGFRALAESGRTVRLFTQDFGDYRWLRAAGAMVEFGVVPETVPAGSDLVLTQPRERDRLNLLLHALACALPENGTLWLAGEIRTGIKSAGKNLAPFFQSAHKADNARHCVLFEARNPQPAKPFLLADYETTWTPPPPFDAVRLVSLPGTFAHGRLDPGTRLLLEALAEQQPSGRVLDFGCGNGVIGLTLMQRGACREMVFLDTSAPALESVRRSLEANGLQADVVPSDGLGAVTGRFDWIVSNPPFHRGAVHDLDTARRFFGEAGRHLHETGKMLLVYNQHLPYPSWLKTHFSRVDIVRANREFRVALVSETG
jgi:16S rRNA (guanine1207-N2)-methyltransferase